jgi:hypothetical protein
MRLRTILVRLFLIVALAMALGQVWLCYEMPSKIPAIGAGVVAAICSAALVMELYVGRWNRRFEARICPACGYDIRATPDRCPEWA